MNKKIFTLFLGALVSLSSLFKAEAATPTVNYKECGYINDVFFQDTLRAAPVAQLSSNTKGLGYYLISVTGIANADPIYQAAFPSLTTGKQAVQAGVVEKQTYVLFVDDEGQLRIDELTKLDFGSPYRLEPYIGSDKISALRHAQWCVVADGSGQVTGSNATYDFYNMYDGEQLQGPIKSLNPANWEAISNGWMFKGNQNPAFNIGTTIDLEDDDELIADAWHFSLTVAGQQLQYDRALYSYTTGYKDSVVVLALDPADGLYETPGGGTGGWKVTVKHVAVKDLIDNSTAENVRTSGSNLVSNVLLFTLKVLQPFVMNADDYNAVAHTLTFTPDAKQKIGGNDWGWNPFTKNAVSGANYEPYGKGLLKAFEAKDSLYRYGYLQFARWEPGSDGTVLNGGFYKEPIYTYGNPNPIDDKQQWLYVDTAFVNPNGGNNEYLKFAYTWERRDTNSTCGVLNTREAFEDNWGYYSTGMSELSRYGGLVWFNGNTKLRTYLDALYTPAFTDYTLDSVIWVMARYLDKYFTNVIDSITVPTGYQIASGPMDIKNAAAITYTSWGANGTSTTPPSKSPFSSTWFGGTPPSCYFIPLKDIFEMTDAQVIALLNYVGLKYGGNASVYTNNTLNTANVADILAGISITNGVSPYITVHPTGTDFDNVIFLDYFEGLDLTVNDAIKPLSGVGVIGGAATGPGSRLLNTVLPEHLKDYEQLDTKTTWYDSVRIYAAWYKDALAYATDSIMENQSKFRVVHDPFNDESYINAYQTRYRYTSSFAPASAAPKWWENSFQITDSIEHPWDTIQATAGAWDGLRPGVRAGNPNGNRYAAGAPTQSYNYTHSFGYIHNTPGQPSNPSLMDLVLISTADTNVFHNNNEPLGHIYGKGLVTNGTGNYYRDSLFYVDIQDVENQMRIATLQETADNTTRTQIQLGYANRCDGASGTGKANIPNNLYLIRNTKGEYLVVPLTSYQDSPYWMVPDIAAGEDPTQMPCFQWTVEKTRNATNTTPAPFTITNREFENVKFQFVTLLDQPGVAQRLNIADPNFSQASFAKYAAAYVYSSVGTKAFGKGAKFSTIEEYGNQGYSFIALDKTVKQDQELGYKYLSRDQLWTNIYALKYKHFIDGGRYLSWYDSSITDADETAYVMSIGNDYKKAYLYLEELPWKLIGPTSDGYTAHVNINKDNVSRVKPGGYLDYPQFIDNYINKIQTWQNTDSLTLESFGYMPTKVTSSGTVYDYDAIADLRPLARQAYRFLIKDWYKYGGLFDGDYLVVGSEDRYIWTDKASAQNYYVPANNSAAIFGAPYFYLRNTSFLSQGSDDDYFALVQRVPDPDVSASAWGPIKAYLQDKFGKIYSGGPSTADAVINAIERSKELGAFVANVKTTSNNASLIMALRGSGSVVKDLFKLEPDNDPIYRRFTWNDYTLGARTYDDSPRVLNFFNADNPDLYLFENTGFDTKGNAGGYDVNVDANGNLLKDSLGYYISFLGVHNAWNYPSVDAAQTLYDINNPKTLNDEEPTQGAIQNEKSNYAIYVDTAYIKRGTGWLKPQYLLAVDPYVATPAGFGCNSANQQVKGETKPYTLARYMFNGAMYAKKIKPLAEDITAAASGEWGYAVDGTNYNLVQPIDENVVHTSINGITGANYTHSASLWERIGFSWAIHYEDKLYVLKNIPPYYDYVAPNAPGYYDAEAVHAKLAADWPSCKIDGCVETRIDPSKLVAAGAYTTKAKLGSKIGLHAIIDLGDNKHKDWVWSFRYVERGSDEFIIESETEGRNRLTSAEIRPSFGGWVKYRGASVPTITRTSETPQPGQGDRWQVEPAKTDPVYNANVGLKGVKVVAGEGQITILNASGKSVKVTNLIGQTVLEKVLKSDSETVKAPKGVTIVSVEGEKSAKAVVK